MNIFPMRWKSRRRRGFTLAELSVSIVSSSILLAGIASSIFIASKSLVTNSGASATMTASLSLADLAADLATAKSFQERTATAITFKVADRNSNGTDETIRYYWNGQAGGSLLRYYNGTSAVAATSVYNFGLSYSTQISRTKRKILFVKGNVTGTRATYDGIRRDRMTEWGYEVLPWVVVAATPQSEINAYAAKVDVVYISSTVVASDIGSRFKSVKAGVLIEKETLYDSFRMYEEDGSTVTDDEVKVEDNTHYITSSFTTGRLVILTENQVLTYCGDPDDFAPDAVILCKRPTGPGSTLTIIDAGGELEDDSSAAGKRVLLPWGNIDFNPALLNSDGQTLWKRALTWATGQQLATAVDVSLQIGSSSATRMETRIEIIGKPSL